MGAPGGRSEAPSPQRIQRYKPLEHATQDRRIGAETIGHLPKNPVNLTPLLVEKILKLSHEGLRQWGLYKKRRAGGGIPVDHAANLTPPLPPDLNHIAVVPKRDGSVWNPNALGKARYVAFESPNNADAGGSDLLPNPPEDRTGAIGERAILFHHPGQSSDGIPKMGALGEKGPQGMLHLAGWEMGKEPVMDGRRSLQEPKDPQKLFRFQYTPFHTQCPERAPCIWRRSGGPRRVCSMKVSRGGHLPERCHDLGEIQGGTARKESFPAQITRAPGTDPLQDPREFQHLQRMLPHAGSSTSRAMRFASLPSNRPRIRGMRIPMRGPISVTPPSMAS